MRWACRFLLGTRGQWDFFCLPCGWEEQRTLRAAPVIMRPHVPNLISPGSEKQPWMPSVIINTCPDAARVVMLITSSHLIWKVLFVAPQHSIHVYSSVLCSTQGTDRDYFPSLWCVGHVYCIRTSVSQQFVFLLHVVLAKGPNYGYCAIRLRGNVLVNLWALIVKTVFVAGGHLILSGVFYRRLHWL